MKAGSVTAGRQRGFLIRSQESRSWGFAKKAQCKICSEILRTGSAEQYLMANELMLCDLGPESLS